MSTLACPHCGADYESGSAFCESCGKALPLANGGGPRVVTAASLPATAAGADMLGDQLQKHTKRAANTLLAVGIVQLVIGGVLIAVMSSSRTIDVDAVKLLLVIQAVVATVFIALSFWARRSPLPASIIGLVLYGTLVVINVVTALSNASAGGEREPGRGIGGLGIGWLDIVIMIFLARGIQAALENRKLLAAQQLA